MSAKLPLPNWPVLTEHRTKYPLLVVDDDLSFQEIIRQYLMDSGYDITFCDSAERAIELMECKSFPLVMCDWKLPGQSGLELCHQLRQKGNDYQYFILMTSNRSDENLVEGFRAGADDYIRKGARKLEILVRLDAGLRVMMQQHQLLKQREEIARQAITDELTGCYNRRHLMEIGEREVKRALRYDQCFSLIMTDVDFFKRVNDTYGHQAGDLVLKKVARSLMESIRSDVDSLCRFGGEEFAILLPNTSLSQATLVAEKLRTSIEELTISWVQKSLKVTSSFGVTSLSHADEPTFESLMAQADACLYQSKESGRNCVTVDHGKA